MYTKRCALLFASMGFAVISTASYLATMDPAHALMHGLCSGFVMSVMGGIMGYMLDNPAGQRNRFWNKFWRDLFSLKPPETTPPKTENHIEELYTPPVEAEAIPNSGPPPTSTT